VGLGGEAAPGVDSALAGSGVATDGAAVGGASTGLSVADVAVTLGAESEPRVDPVLTSGGGAITDSLTAAVPVDLGAEPGPGCDSAIGGVDTALAASIAAGSVVARSVVTPWVARSEAAADGRGGGSRSNPSSAAHSSGVRAGRFGVSSSRTADPAGGSAGLPDPVDDWLAARACFAALSRAALLADTSRTSAILPLPGEPAFDRAGLSGTSGGCGPGFTAANASGASRP